MKNKPSRPRDTEKSDGDTRKPTVTVKDAAKKFNWKLLTLLIVNTVIVFAIYQIFINLSVFPVFLIVFLTVFTVVVFAYIIYNRAFTRKNLTPEMLPDEWTFEVKEEYIEDGRRRLKKSRWMLTVIIPFIFTLGADLITLFVIPYFENLFT